VPARSATGAFYQLRTLMTAFPQATFSSGAETGQIIAWASARDHEQIRALIQRMKTPAEEDTPTLVVYTLEHIEARQAQQILAKIVTGAELTADPANPQRLTAWAVPADHRSIDSALAQIDVEDAAGLGLTAVVYTFEAMDATSVTYALQFLTTAVPTARITRGVQPDQLVAWATPRDHEQLRTLVEQLTRQPPAEQAPRVAVYSLQFMPAASAAELLRRAVPKAEFTTDPVDRGRLIAWANPTDQNTIKMILSDLDVEGEGTAAKVQVYKLEGVTSALAMTPAITLMTTAFPNARFSAGTTPGELVAWGSAKDHAEIKQLVDRLNAGPPPEQAPTAVVYSLQGMDTAGVTYALQFLTSAMPTARFTRGAQPDQVVAWATPKEHEQLRSLVDQLTEQPPLEWTPRATVYTTEFISAANASSVLMSAVPQAKITVDPENPQRLTAWAKPFEHDSIAAILAEIDIEGDPRQRSTIQVYSIPALTTTSAIYQVRTLMAAFPSAQFSLGGEPGQVVAWASAKDHEQIRLLVEQMKTPAPEDTPSLAIYTLQFLDAKRAADVLTKVAPSAQLTPDPDVPQRLTVWAKPLEHQNIEAALQQIDVQQAAERGATAVIYELEGLDTLAVTSAVQMLTSAVPAARITRGAQAGQLVVWAARAITSRSGCWSIS
jgi:ribosomal protein L12E/L44/L45/RPP1/RPP2